LLQLWPQCIYEDRGSWTTGAGRCLWDRLDSFMATYVQTSLSWPGLFAPYSSATSAEFLLLLRGHTVSLFGSISHLIVVARGYLASAFGNCAPLAHALFPNAILTRSAARFFPLLSCVWDGNIGCPYLDKSKESASSTGRQSVL
jgi:hypothetical protein